jgi:glutaredoxin-related protein
LVQGPQGIGQVGRANHDLGIGDEQTPYLALRDSAAAYDQDTARGYVGK